MSDAPPDGFSRHFRQSPVTDPWEPLWSKQDGERFVLTLKVSEQHCNSRGLLHGGVISALADNAMGLSCVVQAQVPFSLVTISMSVDFLSVAPIGSWLEFIATPTKVGRSTCFASVEAVTDGKLVARATAVFQVISAGR
jgi:uncharacterized protein (TIGR00369 family)